MPLPSLMIVAPVTCSLLGQAKGVLGVKERLAQGGAAAGQEVQQPVVRVIQGQQRHSQVGNSTDSNHGSRQVYTQGEQINSSNGQPCDETLQQSCANENGSGWLVLLRGSLLHGIAGTREMAHCPSVAGDIQHHIML